MCGEISGLSLIRSMQMRQYHNEGVNMNNTYKFYQNKQCEYFPCHDVADSSSFNCLFCYCPLYLKEPCLGHTDYILNGTYGICGNRYGIEWRRSHPGSRWSRKCTGSTGQRRSAALRIFWKSINISIDSMY